MLPMLAASRPCCAHLSELSNDSVALVADQVLDGGIAEDGVGVLADLHSASRLNQHLQPAVSWQVLGDHHALGTGLVVDLEWRLLGVDPWIDVVGFMYTERADLTLTGTP
jgi:hypothetical protein